MNKASIKELVKKVNSSLKIKTIFTVFCGLVSVFAVLVFIYMLLHFIKVSWLSALKYIITLGFPFLLVGIIRRLIKAPRPYELYDFFEKPPRVGVKDSFPSRHAFSVFALGTLCLFISPILGILMLVFGALLCFCRVAEGIHFIRDVLAGALIGVISALIAAWILI